MVLADDGLTPAFGKTPPAEAHTPAPCLFRVMDADRPLLPSSRHCLAGLAGVLIGRADRLVVAREGSGAARRLVLGLPDTWMSGRHARIAPGPEGLVFEDLGSTNGSRVNGEPARGPRPLRDGDLLELGRTALLYRAAVPRLAGAPDDLDLAQAAPPAPGLSTLVPLLETEHARLATLARSGVCIILGGETGTGKEVMARALHALSRRAGPFVALNCGALPAGLVEGELFGHRKGAFSGATEDRPGLVRAADGGTLLLDEAGDLPLPAQAALLRVLQEGEVLPVGATRPVRVDVRVLAATHKDLDALVAQGAFRADLLARLSGFTVRLPPLRERREDLGLLVAATLARLFPARAPAVRFTPEAVRALLWWSWPLNVRELAKCLESAAVLAGDAPIGLAHLPEPMRRAGPPLPPGPQVSPPAAASALRALRPLSAEEERHREELIALLREHRGNVTAIARAAGKARMQVQRWLRRYGLDPQAFRQ